MARDLKPFLNTFNECIESTIKLKQRSDIKFQ